MLHLVAFPPSRSDLLGQLAMACDAGDSLVLLEDAVWFTQPGGWQTLRERLPEMTLYALEAEHGVPGNVTPLDAEGLVALTETHERIVSWYP